MGIISWGRTATNFEPPRSISWVQPYYKMQNPVGQELVWFFSLSHALKEDGQVEMVVNVFRLQFPADLSIGSIEVNGDWHVSSVVVLLEKSGLVLLHTATHYACARDFNLGFILSRSQGGTIAA